ncbi:carbamoyltransferase N-terminal domain-containing protein [Nocardioides zeae]|uniref:carbamoyltransferase N-terminal domain-containing protein n=1 Tax=Nocardioides zeae TaxID=1457234 RepID=UPI0027D857ED|nr:carbamoyltransferase N-terminal domain-containing protein [Nocardioides zeae]
MTHDGAVALLEDGRLVFSVEVEKVANGIRYSEIEDTKTIVEILAAFGYKPGDVDEWVVDGWDGHEHGSVRIVNDGREQEFVVAPYRENDTITNLLEPGARGTLALGATEVPFVSYVHVAGHLASAYWTSPFVGEPAFVLIWDGGLFPRLYHVGSDGRVSLGGAMFPLIGHAYASAAHHFGPFRRDNEATTVDDLSVAGKLMAYIALGTPDPAVRVVLAELFGRHFEGSGEQAQAYRSTINGVGSNAEPSLRFVHAFYRDLRGAVEATDEDVLATVHEFLGDLLVERVSQAVRGWDTAQAGEGPWNLCFVGGCALNIKWNSQLRAQSIFRDVWVPPFPNDSGSAFGAACAHRAARGETSAVAWHVRSGPAVVPSDIPPGWTRSGPVTPAELGRLLHETGEPVVVLYGRAELGPRALGGRSIIAPATNPGTKQLLNDIKKREHYRPVAPICMVDRAPQIFDPGVPDPYMLFDHVVREEWVERIPAILHLDGTARLQTVDGNDDPVLAELLRAYEQASGVPVLCNTSANYNGRGFFPDVRSAAEWGAVSRLWSDGVLYEKEVS